MLFSVKSCNQTAEVYGTHGCYGCGPSLAACMLSVLMLAYAYVALTYMPPLIADIDRQENNTLIKRRMRHKCGPQPHPHAAA